MKTLLRLSTLLFLVLATLAEESIIEEYDDQYSETNYLRSILNALLNLNNPFPDWQMTNSDNEAYTSDSDDEDDDDSRYSRNLEIGPKRRVCEIVRRHVIAGHANDGYTYRPSFYYEESCTAAIHSFGYDGEPYIKNKKMCYPNAGGCRNITHELILFRRAPGSTCWEPKPTPVNMGCDCNFPRKRLNSISYVAEK